MNIRHKKNKYFLLVSQEKLNTYFECRQYYNLFFKNIYRIIII